MGRFWIIGLGVGLLLAGRPARVLAAPPTVFFRELMWAGTDRSTADEWVVLGNSTDRVLVLDGWRVTVLSSGNEVPLVSLDGFQIAPHGSLLVASHDQHHAFTNGESALAIDPDLVVSSLTLSNTALQLKLYGPDSTVPIDTAGNGKTPLAGAVGSASKGLPWTAMERTSSVADGTLKTSWIAAASSRHLDSGIATLALPDHAGRPTVSSTTLPSVPATIPTVVSVAVNDPDGDDDIATVGLSCPDGATELVDTGLGGDPIAGDRRYSARVTVPSSGSVGCTATVTDRSGLVQPQSLTRIVYIRTAHVQLSEVLPNPIDGDEWIELENLESNPVDLTGWQLDDLASGGSKPFTLMQTIPANGYLVVSANQSKLALNNTGDDVNLVNPEGTLIDTTHYGAARAGQSWDRVPGGWAWVTQATPGTLNIADPPSPSVSSPGQVVPPVAQPTLPATAIATISMIASSDPTTPSVRGADTVVRRTATRVAAALEPIRAMTQTVVRLSVVRAWLAISRDTVELNRALVERFVGRAERRLTWWRRLDESAIVALLGSLVFLQGFTLWQAIGRIETDSLYRAGG